jgi:four helix bundle protein
MKTEEQHADKEKMPRDIKERTFSFALDIVRLAQRLDECPGVSRALGRQLLRSRTSIGANVEEAQAEQSRADFSSKYAIALKEARETVYWLRLLKECELSTGNECDALLREVSEIARVIGATIVKTKRDRNEYTPLLPFYFCLLT